MNTYKFLITILIVILFNNNSFAKGFDDISTQRRIGDKFNIAAPIAALIIASQEKGAGHFTFIYGQSLLFMGCSQIFGKKTKWKPGRRPSNLNRYDGMPSGHTTSAWTPAAYIRTFSDYKLLSVPFYAMAAFTGYSRIRCKKHNFTQVATAAILSEAVVFVNSKLEWSTEYRTTNVSFGEEGIMASFNFKF